MDNKKDFRIYCEREYIDYLKEVAERNGTSVNRLVLDLVEKKYPMPNKRTHKKDVRLYVTEEQAATLKQIAQEQDTSVNRLIMDVVEKRIIKNRTANCNTVAVAADEHTADVGAFVDVEQVSLDESVLTSSTAVDDVSPESVETPSSDVDTGSELFSVDELLSRGCQPWEYSKDEKDFMKNRITQINQIINNAKDSGNPLPSEQYRKLLDEKNKLKQIVYHNNVK